MDLGDEFLNHLPEPIQQRIYHAVLSGYTMRELLGRDISLHIAQLIAAASIPKQEGYIERMISRIEIMLATPETAAAKITCYYEDIFGKREGSDGG